MIWLTVTEYLCHRWPHIYHVSRGDNHILLSYLWIITKSNIAGAKCSRNCSHMRINWVRTQFLIGFLLLNLQFSACNSLIFSVRSYLLLDVFLFIFIWSLKCLYFDIRLPHTIWYLQNLLNVTFIHNTLKYTRIHKHTWIMGNCLFVLPPIWVVDFQFTRSMGKMVVDTFKLFM
jgi:hypothetical protein